MNLNLFWSYSRGRERDREIVRSHASSDKQPNKDPHKLTIHLIARRKEKPSSSLKMEETGVNVSVWSRYSSIHRLVLLIDFSPPPSGFCVFLIKEHLTYPSRKLSCSGGARIHRFLPKTGGWKQEITCLKMALWLMRRCWGVCCDAASVNYKNVRRK